MLDRWTKSVLRHRASIVVIWIVLSLLGLIAGFHLNNRLTTSFSVLGSDSAKADDILAHHFTENIEGTFTVVLKVPDATAGQLKILESKISAAAGQVQSARVTQERALSGVLFANIATSFNLSDAAKQTPTLRRALSAAGLPNAMVTGPPAIHHDAKPALASDLHRGQLLALLLALALLVLMLGTSWAVIAPFIFAGATISVAIGLVYLISLKMLVVLYIPNIVELIGLGLAIDYSLLIVHRFRREMRKAQDADLGAVIARTMQTAGRTVILSGICVSIGLATMLLVPVPTIRSLEAAGLVVPLVSMAAVLTLQPVLLSFLSRGAATPKPFRGLMGSQDPLNGMIAKVAKFVIRKPAAVLICSLVVLAALAAPVLKLQATPNSLSAIPSTLESARALSILTEKIGSGVVTPNEIVVDLGPNYHATDLTIRDARIKLAQSILQDPEVLLAATGEKDPYIDVSGRYIRMHIFDRHEFGAEPSKKLVAQLRDTYIPRSTFPSGTKIYLSGAPAQGVDLLDALYGSLPWICLLAFALAFVILARAMKSIIIPLKAILLDLVSVAVAYGSLVLVFKYRWGASILGTYKLDQMEAWVLVFLFAVLFGLSMDYEIFIVSRIREARNRGASNSDSIIEGLTNTGGVVTSAAIILIGALAGLVIGHFAGLQELGVGLAIGVLVDATIIRGLLLPSAMVLLGRWNWWLPSRNRKS